MAISKEREYRAMVEMRATESDDYMVVGYATTFNDPYMIYDDGENQIYEEIDSRALEDADVSDVLFLYNHEGRVFARQKNGTLRITTDEHGIRIEVDLSKTSQARSLYEDIKAGMIDKMSWAFSVREDSYNRQRRTRTIRSIKKVFDVSAVSLPANPNTEISARDYAHGVMDAERAERLETERRRLALKLKLSEG